MKHTNENPPEQIMQFLISSWISQAIYAGVRLNLSDLLAAGPLSANELAKQCDAHPSYLCRLMRALSSVGIFRENGDQVFELTSMAICLQTDKMAPIVRMFQAPWHTRAWEQLAHSVKTGEIAFDKAFGMPCFEWLEQNPEAASEFNTANQIKAMVTSMAILNNWDFSGVSRIAYIGGGLGGLLLPILNAHPHLRGTIADLPHLEVSANRQIKQQELTGRCRFVSCDFFKYIPDGHDCYLMSNILHDWDDESSRTILQNCRDAMTEDARLLVIEGVLPEPNTFSISRMLDLEVLVMGGGMERTEEQYRQLFASAGLELESITKTENDVSILACRRSTE